MDKMRVNLVRKVQGSKASSPQPARPASKPTYQEKFVPPKMSMVCRALELMNPLRVLISYA